MGANALLFVLLIAVPLAAQQPAGFDHPQHSRLFLSCQTCHAGARDSTQALWPPATACARCHDGEVEKRVVWQPRAGPRPGNLRFSHATHAASFAKGMPADSVLPCEACHAGGGAAWMDVGPPIVANCLACHGLHSVAHLAAPDSACVSCHVPLPRATGLTAVAVASFPAPPSHATAAFAAPGGHGRLAQAGRLGGKHLAIAQSCTVCHAQDFCAACHVDAPQVRAIEALARDPRSLALGPKERRPAWHGKDFSTGHAALATANPKSCTTCHLRSECLDCHRPNPSDGTARYHTTGYLVRHPADAYARSSDCSQCHNQQYFCASCHQQSGLVARGPLTTGYHNGARFFNLGHGKAAREALETCVSCHTENDCLRCHSAIQGRRFNPHGQGFDGSKLRNRNPQMCSACHGSAIPN
jgi:hypothetical protein